MDLAIYRYQIPKREGLLIRTPIGWGEVTPLPGRSFESLDEALVQLLSLEQGFSGPFFPSVAFGLKSASIPFTGPLSWPAALFFKGTVEQILEQLQQAPRCFSHAKLKIGELTLSDAILITQILKKHFHLRLDMNKRWTHSQLLEFLDYFEPADFDFIEDPEKEIPSFKIAYDEKPALPSCLEVWKPSVKGIPPLSDNLILGSSWESGIGHASIVLLAHHLEYAKTPLGIGTYRLLEEDLLEKPLKFLDGHIHISSITPKLPLLEKIKELYVNDRYLQVEPLRV